MPMTKEERSAYMKKWRVANKDKVKADYQEWVKANKESRAAYMKKYLKEYAETPRMVAYNHERHLQMNYQMSTSQFNEMWISQDGKCAICQIEMLPRGRSQYSVMVDHNHQTGEVRGLLCSSCNRGLGCFKDCPELLGKANQYLNNRGNYSTSDHLKDE